MTGKGTRPKASVVSTVMGNTLEQRLTHNCNHTGSQKEAHSREKEESEDQNDEQGKCTHNLLEQRLTCDVNYRWWKEGL